MATTHTRSRRHPPPSRPGIRRRIRSWIRQWLRRRQGSDGDVVVLDQRRVYILPTRSGLVFALVLFTMLLGSLNYSNNMGFALAFILAAVVVVSIHHCQRNLAGLRVSIGHCLPVFAGEPLECTLNLENPGRAPRWQVAAGPARARTMAVDIPAGGSASLTLRLATDARGRWHCPPIRLSTRHPLGLFESWAVLHPGHELLVYPQPAATSAAPPPAPGQATDDTGDLLRGADEFVGLRAPLPGESWSRMAWKAWARAGVLLAKDYRSGAGACWLSWDELPARDTEVRLSMLTRLIIDAQTTGQPFGLRLPGIELPPGTGPDHVHRSLAILATWESADAPVAEAA